MICNEDRARQVMRPRPQIVGSQQQFNLGYKNTTHVQSHLVYSLQLQNQRHSLAPSAVTGQNAAFLLGERRDADRSLVNEQSIDLSALLYGERERGREATNLDNPSQVNRHPCSRGNE